MGCAVLFKYLIATRQATEHKKQAFLHDENTLLAIRILGKAIGADI